MASQSPQIIFGAFVDAPGRYELCWVTHTEAGEVTATTRRVVVTQHGPWFYLQFTDENFQPYPCSHEGLRCDLLDPSVAWLRPVALVLSEDEILADGDFQVRVDGSGRTTVVAQSDFGKKAACLMFNKWVVLRPAKLTAVNGAAVGMPGLQATG